MANIQTYCERLLLCLGLLSLVGCASVQNYQPNWESGKEYKLTLIHTSDHHGHFWQSEQGEYGMAARATLIDNIREELLLGEGSALLLSAGDINTGQFESDVLFAEPDFKAMKLMGYDAMALGGHEFDQPLDVLQEQHAWAGFPFLAANVLNEKNNQPLFDAYHIFEVDTLKVAVVGFINKHALQLAPTEHLEGIEILPAAVVAQDLIPKLRQQADLVIALTQMGANNVEESQKLAQAVPGIDIMITGQPHGALSSPITQNNTLIVQAAEWGKLVGRLDLVIQNGKVTDSHHELIPVNASAELEEKEKTAWQLTGEALEPSPEVLELLTPYLALGQEEMGYEIGYNEADFSGQTNALTYQETPLANLVTSAMKEKVKADIAISHAGEIQGDLPEGIINYFSVQAVLPSAHTIVYLELTSNELTNYLSAVATLPAGSEAFAHFSGIGFTMENGTAKKISVNGTKLSNDALYRVAINRYMARGNMGYPDMTSHPSYRDSGYLTAKALADYVQIHYPLEANQYRINNAVKR
ncbi:5'-nucleotidase C-terminal domain-containing protein [Marinomonas epiphytica]